MIQDCTNTKIDMPSSRFGFYPANNQSCKHITTKIYLKFDTLNSKLQLKFDLRIVIYKAKTLSKNKRRVKHQIAC